MARPDDSPPDYTVYRSRRRFLPSFSRGGSDRPPKEPRGRRGDGPRPPRRERRRRADGEPRRVGPFIRYGLIAIAAWLALSAVLFAASALIQRQQFDSEARAALGGGSSMITGQSTVLVIGTDRREADSQEPGADPDGPARADTLMLLRAGGGEFRKLSIPRDTLAEIPGHGPQRINAAYAIGGTRLQVQTVEGLLGLTVDHVVEVEFAGFKDFIDAIGGVRVRTGCVISRINGGYRRGGITLRLRPGTHTLNGDQALALARTRVNECRAGRTQDDRTRARRQQQILSGMKSRLTNPLRLPYNIAKAPWIAWNAPRAVVSDMGPVGMSELMIAATIGSEDSPRVLRPSGLGPGGALVVSEEERRRAASRLLGD